MAFLILRPLVAVQNEHITGTQKGAGSPRTREVPLYSLAHEEITAAAGKLGPSPAGPSPGPREAKTGCVLWSMEKDYATSWTRQYFVWHCNEHIPHLTFL